MRTPRETPPAGRPWTRPGTGAGVLILALTGAAGLTVAARAAGGGGKAPETVILDATGVANLAIETVAVAPVDFEETVFALGRTEVVPRRRAVVSSRIAGRIVAMSAYEGDTVEAGEVVVKIESRRPGDPPPVIPVEAPIGGLVMASHSSVGEPVEPNIDILEIVDLSQVYAVARVPEDQAGRLRPGALARIDVAAVPGEAFEGKLLRFGTVANRDSGTLDAVFLLEGLDGRVRPGMRAEFSIVVSRREQVMAVPREAVQGSGAERFVFVRHLELEHAFEKAPVRVGAQNRRFTEITAGLLSGDEVVTRGAYPLAFVSDGGISLQEALDAAHGHKHNPDGSEMTPEQQRAEARAKAAAAAGLVGGHTHAGGIEPLTLFFAALSALLLLLLVLSLTLRRPRREEADPGLGAGPGPDDA